MNPVLQGAIIIIFLSILNESLLEYLFGSIEGIHRYLPLISLGFALFLTFSLNVNLVSIILGIESSAPFVDILLSGFIISRISNFLNDLAQKFLGSK